MVKSKQVYLRNNKFKLQNSFFAQIDYKLIILGLAVGFTYFQKLKNYGNFFAEGPRASLFIFGLEWLTKFIAEIHEIDTNVLLDLGGLIIITGLMFKIGAPFHLWIPDAYQGANIHVLIFLITFPKLVLFYLIFTTNSIFQENTLIMVTLVLSSIIGSIQASAQTKIKRFIAYTIIFNSYFLGLCTFRKRCVLFLVKSMLYLIVTLTTAIALAIFLCLNYCHSISYILSFFTTAIITYIIFCLHYYRFIMVNISQLIIQPYKKHAKVILVVSRIYINMIISPVLRHLKRSSWLHGFKILVAGRLTRKERAAFMVRKFGKVTLAKKAANIEYSSQAKIMRFGMLGVKVWFMRRSFAYKPYFYRLGIMLIVLNYIGQLFQKNTTIFPKNQRAKINKVFVRYGGGSGGNPANPAGGPVREAFKWMYTRINTVTGFTQRRYIYNNTNNSDKNKDKQEEKYNEIFSDPEKEENLTVQQIKEISLQDKYIAENNPLISVNRNTFGKILDYLNFEYPATFKKLFNYHPQLVQKLDKNGIGSFTHSLPNKDAQYKNSFTLAESCKLIGFDGDIQFFIIKLNHADFDSLCKALDSLPFADIAGFDWKKTNNFFRSPNAELNQQNIDAVKNTIIAFYTKYDAHKEAVLIDIAAKKAILNTKNAQELQYKKEIKEEINAQMKAIFTYLTEIEQIVDPQKLAQLMNIANEIVKKEVSALSEALQSGVQKKEKEPIKSQVTKNPAEPILQETEKIKKPEKTIEIPKDQMDKLITMAQKVKQQAALEAEQKKTQEQKSVHDEVTNKHKKTISDDDIEQ